MNSTIRFDLSPAFALVGAILLFISLPGACSRSDDAPADADVGAIETPTAIPMMEIVTPTPGVPQAPQAQEASPAEVEQQPVDLDTGVYIVQSGDTLYSIATRFGVEVAALAEANGITNPETIQVGQILLIPERET